MSISIHPTESYIDPSLNDQIFSSMSLTIELSLNFISFSITDDSRETLLAIVNYTLTGNTSVTFLAEYIEQLFLDPLFEKEFTRVIISYNNKSVSFIPSALYDAKHLAEYLVFNKEDFTDQFITTDFIKEIDSFNVYLLPYCIDKVIKTRFTDAKIIHHSSGFIKSVFHNFPITEKSDLVFVNIGNNEFELIILRNGKLQLYNTFKFNLKEDFLYYLLFAMKQFDCDPIKTELILMGKIAGESSIHLLLLKYIMTVHFANNVSMNKLKANFNEIPEHSYFTLLNLNKCE